MTAASPGSRLRTRDAAKGRSAASRTPSHEYILTPCNLRVLGTGAVNAPELAQRLARARVASIRLAYADERTEPVTRDNKELRIDDFRRRGSDGGELGATRTPKGCHS